MPVGEPGEGDRARSSAGSPLCVAGHSRGPRKLWGTVQQRGTERPWAQQEHCWPVAGGDQSLWPQWHWVALGSEAQSPLAM